MLVKETLHHRKKILWSEIPPFGKELPNDVGRILPPLLSEWTTIEPTFNRLHRMWATMRATFVNLLRDFTMPLVNRHCLVDDQPHECRRFCALALFHMLFHLGEVEGGISFHLLCGIDFLRATCFVIHFLPSLAE
jgi:hypothetical protein